MIRASEQVNRSQRGLIHPWFTKYRICSGVPPEVALDMAHAASFLISNSAFANNWIRGGIVFASMTACICCLFPAVIFDIVQQASFRIPFFGLLSRANKHGRAEQLIIICVCRSSPVTIFPTVRRAGVCTE